MSLTKEQKSFFTNDFSNFWPFIEKLDLKREQNLLDIELQCKEYNIYTVGPWFGKLLNIITCFGNVKSALEFGTANGYSAIWIAKALPENGHLFTIENDPKMIALARDNFIKCGLDSKITLINTNAEEIDNQFDQKFDLIFVDCAHLKALQVSKELLKKNGLFICDNVGFKNKELFNNELLKCSYLDTIYLQCYLKGRIPENTAFSISIRV